MTGLKQVVEFHSGVPQGQQQLWHNNQPLQDRFACLNMQHVAATDGGPVNRSLRSGFPAVQL